MKTKLSKGTYKGQDAVIVENNILKATILPHLGAKIASLIYKPQDFEIFSQPSGGSYTLPQYGADFSDFDTSGADEMFPTIDLCPYPGPEEKSITCPDHGELWSIPWQAEMDDRGRLITTTQGVALPYRFQRTISLNENRLRCEYVVKNLGQQPLLGMWAFHGLTACDDQTRIDLPKARLAKTCEVLNVKDDDMLGAPGGVFDFPSPRLPHQAVDLAQIRPSSVKLTRKYYVNGPLEQGRCSLTLNHNRLAYTLAFPEEAVPYLGVWINEGGYKDEYNCALEPATGFYDSLALAQEKQTIVPLPAHESSTWWMDVILKDIT